MPRDAGPSARRRATSRTSCSLLIPSCRRATRVRWPAAIELVSSSASVDEIHIPRALPGPRGLLHGPARLGDARASDRQRGRAARRSDRRPAPPAQVGVRHASRSWIKWAGSRARRRGVGGVDDVEHVGLEVARREPAGLGSADLGAEARAGRPGNPLLTDIRHTAPATARGRCRRTGCGRSAGVLDPWRLDLDRDGPGRSLIADHCRPPGRSRPGRSTNGPTCGRRRTGCAARRG